MTGHAPPPPPPPPPPGEPGPEAFVDPARPARRKVRLILEDGTHSELSAEDDPELVDRIRLLATRMLAPPPPPPEA